MTEPLTDGLARMLRKRCELSAEPNQNRPRKNSPSTGATRGSPRGVTVARSSTCTPASSALSAAASSRVSSPQIERRCDPARA